MSTDMLRRFTNRRFIIIIINVPDFVTQVIVGGVHTELTKPPGKFPCKQDISQLAVSILHECLVEHLPCQHQVIKVNRSSSKMCAR